LKIRESIGCRNGDVLIGCIAHLVPIKGHPTLLKSLAQVPQARLVIAGKPLEAEYVASLRQTVDELQMADRVHFLGNVQDVPALLSELDITVLPTWAKWRMEGCPVALLEAMSSECACVATDIPGSRDLIEHGRSGLIVPAEDPDALAHALRQLVASPALRQQLGRAARQRVLGHFTIEKEVAAHEALYTEVLGLN
jgi:glycosyltransferase involved in cell wall biosynthesis